MNLSLTAAPTKEDGVRKGAAAELFLPMNLANSEMMSSIHAASYLEWKENTLT